MNSHFKNFRKEKTGKIGVWVLKIKNKRGNVEKKQNQEYAVNRC